jgi:hypothetical protein
MLGALCRWHRLVRRLAFRHAIEMTIQQLGGERGHDDRVTCDRQTAY